jgi:cytochrome P450
VPRYIEPEWLHLNAYKPFKDHNSNIITIASPGRIYVTVADANATSYITTNRNNFPKPIELYRGIDLYGKNVVTLEGQAWRTHRKITAPSFGEKNNELVWQESLSQARGLVQHWGLHKTIADPSAGTMRLALHVISRAGFGVPVYWPHDEGKQESMSEGAYAAFTKSIPEKGHVLTYKDALSQLLENLIWLPILPTWFLRKESTLDLIVAVLTIPRHFSVQTSSNSVPCMERMGNVSGRAQGHQG